MQIVVEIPEAQASVLAHEADPSRALLEAYACEQYRAGKMTRGDVRRLLGLSFFETEEWFYHRGLRRDYDTAELEKDRERIAQLFPQLK